MSNLEQTTALAVHELKKRFGSTIALDGTSFTIGKGEIHALLGENGAGKSTLVKILSGLSQPDQGTISFFGNAVSITGPKSAHGLGIRTAFQEISLVRDLTVSENFLLLEEPLTFFGSVARKRRNKIVAGELERLGLGNIDPDATVATLDLPTRQKIEIARSISNNPKLLLLDEPTASLSANDVEWLFDHIEKLKATGTTVLFISHRMQEVREFCTNMTVLRNGISVGSFAVNDVDDDSVIEMMIGKSLSTVFPAKTEVPRKEGSAPALSVRNLQIPHSVKRVNLDLYRGQILGVAGLQGMGQRQIFLRLFGAIDGKDDQFAYFGKESEFRTPNDAVRAGIGLVPEERKSEGLLLDSNALQNLALPSMSHFTRLGLVDRRKLIAAVSDTLARLKIAGRAVAEPAAHFSGGNQQKMVIAKWILAETSVLLLYDPTRGVDVATKAEIYNVIHEFAAAGGAVLLYSSDVTELVNLCETVLVVYRGEIAAKLTDRQINETAIMRAAVGGHRPNAGEEHNDRVAV